jgi:DNA mismatch repair ATPase MutS
VANGAAQSGDHVLSYFTMLRAELAFVSCLNLRDLLLARRAPVSFPDPLPYQPLGFSCLDLRDASLVLQAGHPVTGNDVRADGKSLVIITGANSGGKSTFVPSVGLAQLMTQCGRSVTAQAYRGSVSLRNLQSFHP